MRRGLFCLIALLVPALCYSFSNDYGFIPEGEHSYAGAFRGAKEFRGFNPSYTEGSGTFVMNTYPTEHHPVLLDVGKSGKTLLSHNLFKDWKPRELHIEKIEIMEFGPFTSLSYEQWKVNMTFPLDFSLHYFFDKHWSTALSYRSFGGWYRSFFRIGREAKSSNSMISAHANGVDLGLYLNSNSLTVGFFGGANFGGHFLVHHTQETNSIEFQFETAAYGGIRVSLRF